MTFFDSQVVYGLVMTSRTKGLTLVAISALLFSTPGLFTRGVSASGWDVIFWRGVFGILFTGAYLVWRGQLREQLSRFGWTGWANALLWSTGAIGYLQAYKLTTIAEVSLIYGAAPILAALLAWIWFGERPRNIVLAASLLAFIGVAVIGAGALGAGHLLGDALALWMTITVAISFNLFRKYPDTPAAASAIVASAIALVPSLIFGDPFHTSAQDIAVLAVFGAVFSVASILLAEGSKYLPAGETALMSNLEVPVQPALAFLVFAEWPSSGAFAGGALILIAIMVSSWPNRGTVLVPE